MSVPQELLELVDRFNTNREAYRSGQYNETQLRREFIDPLFQILGWDVNNEKGYAEAYKDVIHEDSIKVGGVTKAPDYCFRIGGARKFFVETKKPSVNLKDDISPAFQLRRYAWSAKLPLSILTDFEEFVVYDCRAKPDKSDKASTARILYLTSSEYAHRWDEISQVFSRDAVLKGSFDRYAESTKVKKGTASVDDAFLKEIESWRDVLARSLALRNPDLNQHDLNFSVQRTIDRIVFLRICEDRGMEQYGRLMSLQNGDRVYARLREMFHRADERYNSGLFHFQKDKGRTESPDTLTLNLAIDDSTLKSIIKNLYYPDSPYEFSVISADILGQVYEQFLGKVIRLTAGHRAVVEEKPEVRKAGGVYYTPTYIVDYIVKNTVGKLLGYELQNSEHVKIPISKGGKGVVKSPLTKGEMGVVNPGIQNLSSAQIGDPKSKFQNPKQVSKLKILDPACGSGSFLLGAYQYLLDWHRDWYVANDPEKWATGRSPALYQVSDSNPPQSPFVKGGQRGITGNWRLTAAERKRILLNNIYGVDIDPQAVEVTKLSLLLKVLEGESEQTIVRQLKMFHERALPDLGNNIKCGNSLINTDFYHTPQTALSPSWRGIMGEASDEERYRINPFDWDKEFPEIMQAGGFDVVIGNPPYVVLGNDIFSKVSLAYLNSYPVAHYKTDLFHLFIQKGIDLLKVNGLLGYITPNTWFTLQFTKELRKYVLTKTAIQEIDIFGHKVFQNTDVHTGLIFLMKSVPESTHEIAVKKLPTVFNFEYLNQPANSICCQVDWLNAPEFRFEIRQTGKEGILVKNILSKFPTLEDVARASLGCQAYNSSKHTQEQIKNRVFHATKKLSAEYLPELAGNDIGRYIIERKKGEWIKYGPWLHDYRSVDWLTGPRILIREIAGKRPYRICACYTEETYCNYKTILNVNPSSSTNISMKYMLGILNSRLLSFLYPLVSNKIVAQSFPRLSVRDVKRLPIRNINFSDHDDKVNHDRMVALVNQMLELHKQLASAKTDHDKTVIQRHIDATDRQIDQLVYELYELTEEEIKIVEETITK